LATQSSLIAAAQNYQAARYDYLSEGLHLKSMAGILTCEDLQAVNALLSKQRNKTIITMPPVKVVEASQIRNTNDFPKEEKEEGVKELDPAVDAAG